MGRMPHLPQGVDRLVSDLRRLGVAEGDLVMVHASLRRIGPVEGGAEGVIEAVGRAVGQDGTVMMVLGARDDHDWVNDLPEDDREGLLVDAEPFDCLHTPADPDVGVLAEVFRTHPGTVVSDHPEGRFGARGRLADHLVSDPPWDDYYGPGSALERFVEADGRVLRMGADPDTVTLLHYVEYLAEVPDKRRVLRHRRVLRDGSVETVTVASLDDSGGIVDYPGEYFADLLEEYLASGRARIGRVGGATSELLDAEDLVAFGRAWMESHLVG